MLQKYFIKRKRQTTIKVSRRYYCKNCHYPFKHENSVCPKCVSLSQCGYIIDLSTCDQVKSIINRPGIHEKLRYKDVRKKKFSNNMEDIYDGQVYLSECGENGILSQFPTSDYVISFTMCWTVDGFNPYDTNLSLHPFCLCINELPYWKR